MKHTFVYRGRKVLAAESPLSRWSSTKGSDESSRGKFVRFAKLGLIADRKREQWLAELTRANQITHRRACMYAALLCMDYGIRVGNEDSADGQVSALPGFKGEVVRTYGVTTLRVDHVFRTGPDEYTLSFTGKKMVQQSVIVDTPALVHFTRLLVRQAKTNRPLIGVSKDELTKFVKEQFGKHFKVKDLRTFCANCLASRKVKKARARPPTSRKEARVTRKAILEFVARHLGNTPAVCARSYVDPKLLLMLEPA